LRVAMAVSQVVKITSKGQFTLPVEIRRDLSLGRDSYLYVTRVGQLVVIKKVEELSLDDISAILEPLAKKDGVTRKILMADIERTRAKSFEERHGKTHAHRPN
jgi:bifunctional DNA-binding transcriptional regulator/antitoxin component of YhaV-PrlF toxin-antitoxin module